MSDAQRETADVVVIGGGIFGCSAAYHLRQMDTGRVILLEREPELAAGTSQAAAGFLAPWSVSAPDPEPELSIERYSLDFYRALAARHPIELNPVGLAHVATTDASDLAIRHAYTLAHERLGVDAVALLTPDELGEVAPVIDTRHVRAALLVRSGFSLNAELAVRALGRELVDMGCEVRTGTPVTGIMIEDGAVRGVETPAGQIMARYVVVAAGAWLRDVAGMAGIHLPLIVLEATRFVTEPLAKLPATMPMLMFPAYHNLYARVEQGGLLIGCEEIVVHPPSLMRDIAAPHGPVAAGRSPVSDATHHYHLWLARAFAHVTPVFAACLVREVRSGFPTRVPDMRHVLGQTGMVAGLYLIGADMECGMTRGPGLGKLLAERVLRGRASLDIGAYRPDRWGSNPCG